MWVPPGSTREVTATRIVSSSLALWDDDLPYADSDRLGGTGYALVTIGSGCGP